MKKLIQLLFLAILSSLWCTSTSGQSFDLNGRIVDSFSGDPIAYANLTVGLADNEPYRIENFAVSDYDGKFQLSLKTDSRYIIQASYLGYVTFIDTLNAGEIPEQLVISLQPAANDLSTIEVTYKLPIKVSGDTISYASDAFTDGSERKLEDVLKKLPGFSVADNGQISVNGKKIENLKVDGKDFFGGNAKLASRSLPADAIDRIDVLNNYANDERKGQFANGQGTALNIQLREDQKNLIFGSVYAGYGVDDKTDVGADVFYFGPTASVNLITNNNDIGRQILTFQDMFRFNGGFSKDRSSGAISLAPSDLGLGAAPELNAQHSSKLAALSLNYQPGEHFKASSTLIYGDNQRRSLSNSLRTVLGQNASSSLEQAEDQSAINNSITGLLMLDYQASDALTFSYQLLAGNGKNGFEASTNVMLDGSSIPSLFQNRVESTPSLRQQLSVQYSKTERELWVWRFDHKESSRASEYGVRSAELPFSFSDTISSAEAQLTQTTQNLGREFGSRLDFYRSLNNTNQINLFGGAKRAVSLLDAQLSLAEELSPAGFLAVGDQFGTTTGFFGVGHQVKFRKWKFSPGLRFEYINWQQTTGGQSTEGQRAYLLPFAELEYNIRKSSMVSLTYSKQINWPGADRRTNAVILRDLYTLETGSQDLTASIHHNVDLSYYNYNLFNQMAYYAGITANRMVNPLTQQLQLQEAGQVVTSTNTDRPQDLISAHAQVDKYLEKFKFSSGIQTSLVVTQINLGEITQLNRSLNTSFNASIRTRFKKTPNLAISGRISQGNYRAGTQDARKYLTAVPAARLYGNISPRFSFSTNYRYRTYRRQGSDESNILASLEGNLRYETKNKRFSYEIQGYNLLNNSNNRQESFSDFLLSVTETAILNRRIILICRYNL